MADDVSRDMLVSALKEDWYSLMMEGDSWEFDDGTSLQTVHNESMSKGRWETYWGAVTQVPDGRYFQWGYSLGNTEMQENTGPAEYGEPELVEVNRHEKVITVVEWIPVPTTENPTADDTSGVTW